MRQVSRQSNRAWRSTVRILSVLALLAALLPPTTARAYDGLTQTTAFPYTAPGPISSTVTSQGYTWFATNVVGGRTFNFAAAGAWDIYFYDSSGIYIGGCYSSICSAIPASSMAMGIKVYGPSGAALTLTSVDGSNLTNAYSLPSGADTLSENIPSSSSAYFVTTLSAATYLLGADGPSVVGLTVYNSAYAQVATTAGSSLNFTPAAAGTFYIQVSTGASGGRYTLGYGLPYTAPGPQAGSVGSQGSTWYGTNVTANRTFIFTANGAGGISGVSSDGFSLGNCFVATCSFVPSSGLIWIQVSGTAGASLTLSSVDGSNFTNAYPLPPGGGTLSENIPASSSAYFAATLSATSYTLGAAGPSVVGMTVFDSAHTQLASTASNSLNFTPAAVGTYYIQVSTGASSGSYTLGYGLSYTAPGPQTGSISGSGSTWYGVSLTANRTFNFSATGATSISFYVSGSPYPAYGCSTSCSYVPSSSGLVWVQISGAAGAALTLTSTDGSNLANAYTLPSGGGVLSENIPSSSSAYFVATLSAATYMLGADGPPVAGLTVYNSSYVQLATTAGNSLNFTPGAAGTFYIRVSTGTSNGNFTLGYGLSYTAPGPQAGSIGSLGFTWYGASVAANRAFVLTANGATGLSFTNGTGWFQGSCTAALCSCYAPGSNLLWIKVSGTGGAALTLTSADGSNFANAYPLPSGGGVLSENIPASSSAYFVAALAGTTYTLGAGGPSVAGLAVYNSTFTQVATTTGSSLTFTPPAAGTFYVQVTTGANSGSYTLGYGLPYTAPGPQAGNIGSQGYTWYAATVNTGRGFQFTASGATSISFTTSTGSSGGSCTAATCSFGGYSALVWIQVSGTAGAALTLTSADGSSFAGAYTLPSGGGVLWETIPAGSSAYFLATLSTVTYTLGANGPTVAGLTVYNSTYTQVAATTGSSLSFTPAAAGTFYIQVSAGTSSGNYTLGYGLPFTAPGPQAGSIGSQGFTWYGASVTANRTFQFTAAGAAAIAFYDNTGYRYASCSAATCSFMPGINMLAWIQVSGAPGAGTTLTAADGSSFAMAYPLTALSTIVTAPQYSTALFRIDHMGPYAYQLGQAAWTPPQHCPPGASCAQQQQPPAPNGMTVYNSAQAVVISTSYNSLTFTPGVAGTYYVSMNTTPGGYGGFVDYGSAGGSGGGGGSAQPYIFSASAPATLAVNGGSTSGPGGTLNLMSTSSAFTSWTALQYKRDGDWAWGYQATSGSFSGGSAVIPWTVPTNSAYWQVEVDLTDAAGNVGHAPQLALYLPPQPSTPSISAGHQGDLFLSLPPVRDWNTTYTLTRSSRADFATGNTDVVAPGVGAVLSTATVRDGVNHVANSSFEWGTLPDGTPKDWTRLGTGSYSLDSTNPGPGLGATSLHINRGSTSGQDGVLQSIFTGAGLNGHQITLSGWLNTSNVSAGTGAGAWLELRFLKRDGTPAGPAVSTTALAGTNAWQRCSVTATVPAQTYTVQVAAVFNQASGDVWFDGIQVEPGSQMSPFVAGALQNVTTYYYQAAAWSGPLYSAPSATVSVQYTDLPDTFGRWNRGYR